MRIFVDANILFSSAVPESLTGKLLIAATAYAEIITNLHAIEEALRNLAVKKPDSLAGFSEVIKLVRVNSSYKHLIEKEIPDHDIPIIAGAIGSGCTYLWTSDKKHFGKWYGKSLQGVIIISSIMLADFLMEKGLKRFAH